MAGSTQITTGSGSVEARILAHHADAVQHAALATTAAAQAVDHAIAAGELLLAERENRAGEFDDWLATLIASRDDFSRSTAYNYMRAVRYKKALDEPEPEFGSLKELYIAAGILPPPTADQKAPPKPPLFRIKFDLNGPPPEQWEPMDRREFLERVEPIVQLYERVKAAEAA
jgi:hypothetical protein